LEDHVVAADSEDHVVAADSEDHVVAESMLGCSVPPILSRSISKMTTCGVCGTDTVGDHDTCRALFGPNHKNSRERCLEILELFKNGGGRVLKPSKELVINDGREIIAHFRRVGDVINEPRDILKSWLRTGGHCTLCLTSIDLNYKRSVGIDICAFMQESQLMIAHASCLHVKGSRSKADCVRLYDQLRDKILPPDPSIVYVLSKIAPR
jgi:hypothetical protein